MWKEMFFSVRYMDIIGDGKFPIPVLHSMYVFQSKAGGGLE